MSVDRPQLKVLMMSGFTAGMLVLNEGWHFLTKPFIPSQLTCASLWPPLPGEKLTILGLGVGPLLAPVTPSN